MPVCQDQLPNIRKACLHLHRISPSIVRNIGGLRKDNQEGGSETAEKRTENNRKCQTSSGKKLMYAKTSGTTGLLAESMLNGGEDAKTVQAWSRKRKTSVPEGRAASLVEYICIIIAHLL